MNFPNNCGTPARTQNPTTQDQNFIVSPVSPLARHGSWQSSHLVSPTTNDGDISPISLYSNNPAHPNNVRVPVPHAGFRAGPTAGYAYQSNQYTRPTIEGSEVQPNQRNGSIDNRQMINREQEPEEKHRTSSRFAIFRRHQSKDDVKKEEPKKHNTERHGTKKKQVEIHYDQDVLVGEHEYAQAGCTQTQGWYQKKNGEWVRPRNDKMYDQAVKYDPEAEEAEAHKRTIRWSWRRWYYMLFRGSERS